MLASDLGAAYGDAMVPEPEWRVQVLRPAVFVMVVAGAPLWLMWVLAGGGPADLATLVAGVGVGWLAALLVARASWRWLGAGAVGVPLAIGLAYTPALGLRVGPMMVASLGVIVAGAVFGRKAALLAALTAYAVLVAIGWAISAALLDPPVAALADVTQMGTWVRTGLATMGAALAIATLVAGVVSSLERSLTEQRRALDEATRAYRGRLEAEERRRTAEQALATAARLEAVGRLAGGVAHDFNNLLQLIGLTVEDLKGRAEDPALIPGLESIEAAVGRAGDLTRRLLTLGHRTVRAPGVADLAREVPRVVEPWTRVLPGDIRLVLDIEPGPPVRMDPGELDQVVLNLLLNARDALPRGGEICVGVRPALPDEASRLPAGAWMRLSVRDTGVGMDADTVARLWEPFFTTKAHGTGLGLPMVHTLVELLGGVIEVGSSPGAGAEFIVWLPCATDAELDSAPPEALVREPERAPGLLLVVEDDPAVRAQEVRLLSQSGYEVLAAEDAATGLTLALGHLERLQAVVTDGVMPGLPVSELVTALRARRPELPVLICSGHLEEDLLRRGVTDGNLAYLAKPFRPAELLDRVRALTAT